MPARYFVDENDLALGKALDDKYGTVVYPGHPRLPSVARGSLDDEWLPVVGRDRLIVITRDQRIRYRTVEMLLWMEHHVRGFVLTSRPPSRICGPSRCPSTGRSSQSTAVSLEILAQHWFHLEALGADRPEGPWMYAVTRDRVHEIALG